MKLAIVGSREFNDYERFINEIELRFLSSDACLRIKEIVSGGARGADSLGARFAKQYNIKLTEFIPDWDKHGKAAGFIRNEDIIKCCDEVLCFWDGVSRGTGNALSIAKRLKKPTTIIYF